MPGHLKSCLKTCFLIEKYKRKVMCICYFCICILTNQITWSQTFYLLIKISLSEGWKLAKAGQHSSIKLLHCSRVLHVNFWGNWKIDLSFSPQSYLRNAKHLLFIQASLFNSILVLPSPFPYGLVFLFSRKWSQVCYHAFVNIVQPRNSTQVVDRDVSYISSPAIYTFILFPSHY